MVNLPPTPTSTGYVNESMDSDQFSLHDVQAPPEVLERPEGPRRDRIAQVTAVVSGAVVLGMILSQLYDLFSQVALGVRELFRCD